jgi:hypothetical protein
MPFQKRKNQTPKKNSTLHLPSTLPPPSLLPPPPKKKFTLVIFIKHVNSVSEDDLFSFFGVEGINGNKEMVQGVWVGGEGNFYFVAEGDFVTDEGGTA